MATQSRIVHLRVYRGAEINYTADGKIKNENHLVKINPESMEGKNFLSFMRQNGYAKVKVEKVLKGDKLEEGSEDDKKEAQAFIAEYLGTKKEEIVDPRDKAIAELRAEIEALKSGKNPDDKKADDSKDGKKSDTTEDDIEALRKEYKEVVGKASHPSWNKTVIKNKIEEAKK